MPIFQYTARDRSGVVTNGTVEAESNSVAAARLREQGLWVTGLQATGTAVAPPSTGDGAASGVLDPWWTGVSLKEQVIFFRQFGTMVNAGMSLYRCLTILESQTANGRLRRVIGDLVVQVQAGNRLSDAMRRHPALFRPLQLAMVEAAEAGGLLDQMLTRIADYLEREYEVRLQIKQRTFYPKLLLVAAIFIPSLPTLVFRGGAAYLQETVGSLVPVALVLLVLWIVARFLFQIPAIRVLYDTVKLLIPGVGGIVRRFAVGKFCRSLAALYGAGVPVARAMRTSADGCDNAVIARSVYRHTERVERGEKLSNTLAATGLFPPIVLGMISTGEQSGNMEQMLQKVADYQEQEAEHATKQTVVALGVAIYLVIALFVASKILSFWGGYGSQFTSQ